MKPCVSTTAMMITIYSRFNCKIPFLNGGLFDPIGSNGGYDWVHTDICLPDSLFSNKNKTKEGDIGDGILDIFDRYNFTVREDEPMEKEVAIDPELLGKAYEKFNAIRPDNFEEYKKDGTDGCGRCARLSPRAAGCKRQAPANRAAQPARSTGTPAPAPAARPAPAQYPARA